MLFGIEAPGQVCTDSLLEVIVISLIELRRLDVPLRFAGFVAKFVNRATNLFDLCVGELNRIHYGFFFNFLRTRLDHYNAFSCADDHDIQQAVTHLAVGRIDDETAVYQADAHRANRPLERNIGNRQSSGCRSEEHTSELQSPYE